MNDQILTLGPTFGLLYQSRNMWKLEVEKVHETIQSTSLFSLHTQRAKSGSRTAAAAAGLTLLQRDTFTDDFPHLHWWHSSRVEWNVSQTNTLIEVRWQLSSNKCNSVAFFVVCMFVCNNALNGAVVSCGIEKQYMNE